MSGKLELGKQKVWSGCYGGPLTREGVEAEIATAEGKGDT